MAPWPAPDTHTRFKPTAIASRAPARAGRVEKA